MDSTPVREQYGGPAGSLNTPPRPMKRSRSRPVMRQRAEHKPWIHMAACDGGWFQSADGTRHSAEALGEGGFVALTYNVWMAREHEEVRWAALFDIVDRANPHVVCFQEATGRFVAALAARPWVQERYVLSHTTVDGDEVYTPMLMVRRGHGVNMVAEFELPSKLCRSLLTATMLVGGISVTVATTHLESNKSNQCRRLEQLECIQEQLLTKRTKASRPHGHVVFMGDFNFDYLSPEQDTLDPRWIDAWMEGGDGSPGYTVDTTANAMLRAKKKERVLRVRYDRVLVAPPHRRGFTVDPSGPPPLRLTCFECALLGTAPIPIPTDSPTAGAPVADAHAVAVADEDKGEGEGEGGEGAAVLHPSDHFGILARFALTPTPPPTAVGPAATAADLGAVGEQDGAMAAAGAVDGGNTAQGGLRGRPPPVAEEEDREEGGERGSPLLYDGIDPEEFLLRLEDIGNFPQPMAFTD
eukprot:m.436797 g.436797  ORF g.436797 m.436797 type:complete len:469 (+) comp18014_c0_seq1:170-1576(+)